MNGLSDPRLELGETATSSKLFINYNRCITSKFEKQGMKFKDIVLFTVLFSIFTSPAFAKNEKEKDKPLPQGLQKKLERGGELPPGWQKKLVKGAILEQPVYSQSQVVIPVDSEGLLTIRVEGKLIKLIEATREIIEIVDLLNQ